MTSEHSLTDLIPIIVSQRLKENLYIIGYCVNSCIIHKLSLIFNHFRGKLKSTLTSWSCTNVFELKLMGCVFADFQRLKEWKGLTLDPRVSIYFFHAEWYREILEIELCLHEFTQVATNENCGQLNNESVIYQSHHSTLKTQNLFKKT